MKNMKYKGFSVLDMDKIVANQDFSAETVRFIALMRHLIVTKKDDFVITKKLVLEACCISERTYRKVMKEAKDYIKLTRKRIGSAWSYTYELLQDTFTKTVKPENKQSEPKKEPKEEVIEDISVNNLIEISTTNTDNNSNNTADTELSDKADLVKACINPMHIISKTTIKLLKKIDYFELVSVLEPIFTKNEIEHNKVSIRYVENALKIYVNNRI